MSDLVNDELLRALLDTPQNAEDRVLAARYAPILRFDAHEPFFPLVAGYTIFRDSGPSLSFRQGHIVDLAPEEEPPASLAIESKRSSRAAGVSTNTFQPLSCSATLATSTTSRDLPSPPGP